MAGPDLSGLVNPSMLVWAREAARLDRATAASRAGVSEERLQEWEAGERSPTLSQIRGLAGVYKRSMGIFFLDAVPRTAVAKPVDYRRFELSATDRMSPELATGIREALAKREGALDIFTEMEEEPPRFDLALTRDVPPEAAAASIAGHLGIAMRTRRSWGDEYAALAGWRSAIESLGVIVIQLSGVPLEEMRGAAISLRPLPIILLNAADTPLARLFSMLHELTHLARSESALCDEVEDAPRPNDAQAVEVYCNHVAGALLVPQPDLLGHPLVQGSDASRRWSRDELQTLRRAFWASREVVLRRLLIAGRTSPAYYGAMRAQFQAEYQAMRDRPADGFVPFPRRVILSNGRVVTQLALNAYTASVITGSELSRLLGTKLSHLPKITAMLRERVA